MASRCKYCGQEIYWSNVNGPWVPFEDQSCIIRHQCRKPGGLQETLTTSTLTLPPPVKPEPFTDQEIVILKKLVHSLVA